MKQLTLEVGRYRNIPIDKLPLSYLRWVVTQKFSPEIIGAALDKLNKSDYNNTHMNVTRHALDSYSKLFLYIWVTHVEKEGQKADGFASFVTNEAIKAWEQGKDISKHRYEDDGIIKTLHGVSWVFHHNSETQEFKDVVTVYASKPDDIT